MDHQELNRIAQELERSSKRQLKFARMQCIFSGAAAVCCLLLLVAALSIAPRLMGLVDSAQELAVRADSALTDLETAASDLAEADLKNMVDQVTTLVGQSSEAVTAAKEGVSLAVEKINAIDIETLNQAIRDFSDVVEPLAKFFNIFG